MSRILLVVLVVVAATAANAADAHANPLGRVLDLMADLSAKITNEGEAEAKAYGEFTSWCKDVSRNGEFQIKTSELQKEDLEATSSALNANIDSGNLKISELAADIASGENDLKVATALRRKEAEDFSASEKELTEVISTLDRAGTILQRQMQQNPAALAQITSKGLAGVVQTLEAVVAAAAFSAADKQRLVALVQAQQGSDEEDGEFGAPAADAYKSHSQGVVDVVEELKEKAETNLAELRKAEVNANYNYGLLKQSLEDQLSADNRDMKGQKAGKAAAEEDLATAQGDLAVTVADLKSATDELESARGSCVQMAADHEASDKARTEELKVLAVAIGTLKTTTTGAAAQSYSLLQVGTTVGIRTHADLARSEVVALLKKLSREYHSPALAQLASRVVAVIRASTGGASSSMDPFAKVKTLIEGMLAKLDAESASEATEKSFCDEELAKTGAKQGELDTDIAKLSLKLDQASSRSAQLSQDIRELQSELATLAKEQSDNVQWRQDSHADYVTAKTDLEDGLAGVRKALDVLRTYYAQKASAAAALLEQPAVPLHSQASGAAGGIIGILEAVESDFATTLVRKETEESAAQDAYDEATQQYKLSKTRSEQDAKHKQLEVTSLEKAISDLSTDRDSENSELAAVLEYYSTLKQRCIAKPETYEVRQKHRESEIEGLKQALSILESDAAFVQKAGGARRGRHMRGALSASTF